ncbi:MAG TPA: hypothetical protein VGE74_17825 [Gemmata sp.]
MRVCMSLVACAVFGAAGTVAIAQQATKVPILETYKGTVANTTKPELKTHFIASEDDWKTVWTKINPKAKLPAVDFSKHLLLVTQQDAADPNRSNLSVTKDDKGVVGYIVSSTLIGFEASDRTTYQFYKVSREGVTGVRRYDGAQKKTVVDPLPK